MKRMVTGWRYTSCRDVKDMSGHTSCGLTMTTECCEKYMPQAMYSTTYDVKTGTNAG